MVASQTSTIQPKLTIGAPGDKYEQEADRVAAQVLSMPDAVSSQPVQREVDPDNPDELQRKPLAKNIPPLAQREVLPKQEKSGLVQAKHTLNPEPQTPNLESQLNTSKRGGAPLPTEVRRFMEPRFGADFSQVRVHTGGKSIQMNRDLSAQAFTHGQNIYFGAGKAPANDALTAHELTHVVQQGAAQTSTLIQKLDWDRDRIEARAGRKKGRSEEYKNIVRIVENYSALMNPLAAPRGLQELITACSIWLSKHQGDTSDNVQVRVTAIQELMAAAKQELNILIHIQNAPDPQAAEDSTEMTDEVSNSEFEADFEEEGETQESSYKQTPANVPDEFSKAASEGSKGIDNALGSESQQESQESTAQGEVIGEEGHVYFKDPTSAAKGEAKPAKEAAKELTEDLDPIFEDSFADFNEKINQPKGKDLSSGISSGQVTEKQGLLNKLVAASNRLVGKLFRGKKSVSTAKSTDKDTQGKLPEKAAKSLTQKDYDEILAAIPKTDNDLEKIAKTSKYKSLRRLGGDKDYEESDYYKEFESSFNFTQDKANRWAKPLNDAERELAEKERKYPAKSKEVQDAEAKVKRIREGLIQDYAMQGIKANPKTGRADLRQFMDFKVKYLDKTERQNYKMGMNGQITQQGKPFDTGEHVTVEKGKGWAIYVMSPDGFFYSASHIVGRFHHSSFLSGGAVAGAGEWLVQNGRLVEINGKTGHYTAGSAEMFQVLCELEEQNIPLQGLKMALFREPPQDAYQWKEDNKDIYGPKPDNQVSAYSKSPDDNNSSKEGDANPPYRKTTSEDLGEKGDASSKPESVPQSNNLDYSYAPNINNGEKPGSVDAPYKQTPAKKGSNDASEPSGAYKQTPAKKESNKTDSAPAAERSTSVPQSSNPAYGLSPLKDDDGKSDGAPAAERSAVKPAKQEVEDQLPAPGAAPPAPANTVTGHTGVVVSQAMVQAIRRDILATGPNSKWADQAEIVALATAMGIRINIKQRPHGQCGNSGRTYHLIFNGRDHYDAYLQVSVDPQTGRPRLKPTKIPGNGDCFYKSISEIQKSYGVQAMDVGAMRALVNQTLTDQEVADMAVGLEGDYPNGMGLGDNFRQLMQSGINHIGNKSEEKK
jgi:hypothetical protein